MPVIRVAGNDERIETQVRIKTQGSIYVGIESRGSISAAGHSVGIAATGDTVIKGSLVSIDGAVLRLYGETKPVARSGDLTMPNPTPGAPSIIASDCSSVLA